MNIRITTILAVLLAAPVAAMAQNAPVAPESTTTVGAPEAPAAGHHGHRNMMMQALQNIGLSSDQMAQIKSIMQDTRSKNQGADADTRKANMQAAREQIEALLTADQKTQLTAELKQMRAERRAARNGAPSAPASPAP